jgi:hypothetical protein
VPGLVPEKKDGILGYSVVMLGYYDRGLLGLGNADVRNAVCGQEGRVCTEVQAQYAGFFSLRETDANCEPSS